VAELPPTPKLVIKNLGKEKEPEPERSKTPKPPKVIHSSYILSFLSVWNFFSTQLRKLVFLS
jgi:hypothetical protein